MKKRADRGVTVERALTAEEAEAMAKRQDELEAWQNSHDQCLATVQILTNHTQVLFDQYQEVISKWNIAQGFWESDNTGEKIALMHSELSEALEADRKNLDSDVIPSFSGMEEELADVLIRVFDFAGYHGLELAAAMSAKLKHNLTRPFRHGKKY